MDRHKFIELTNFATTGYNSCLINISHKLLRKKREECLKHLTHEPLMLAEIERIQGRIDRNEQRGPYETRLDIQIKMIQDSIVQLKDFLVKIELKLEEPDPIEQCAICRQTFTLDYFREITDSYAREKNMTCLPRDYDVLCNPCRIEANKNKQEQKKTVSAPISINSNCFYSWKGGCTTSYVCCQDCQTIFCSKHQVHRHQCSWINCQNPIVRPNIHKYCEMHINLISHR
jgi:hypothetical protein